MLSLTAPDARVYATYLWPVCKPLGATIIAYDSQRLIASHYSDITMDAIPSQITSLTIVNSTVYSDADQRKHQSSASLAFVRGIHRWPVNSPYTWPVMRKMFPFDDVTMSYNLAMVMVPSISSIRSDLRALSVPHRSYGNTSSPMCYLTKQLPMLSLTTPVARVHIINL